MRAKPAKSEYRRNLPHIQVEGKPIFVTFATRKRWVLPGSLRDIVLRHCLHDHRIKLYMHGIVVMPDHVHMVFTPLTDSLGNVFGLAEIMNGIKGSLAHSINKELKRKGHVWEKEYFDRILRKEESVTEKVEYICMNPVRKGIVKSPDEYPWLWREWVEGKKVIKR